MLRATKRPAVEQGGWVFSNRFKVPMVQLGDIFNQHQKITGSAKKQKDFDCLRYV